MKKEEITPEAKQKTLDELNTPEETTEQATMTEDGRPITKVTSIAEEEERTGKKIEVPTADKLVANASMAILQTRRGIHQTFAKMSKKAQLRAISAIFSLPEEGVPVDLKTGEEKMAYALAQRHMMARFTVMQYHVNEERKKRMEEAVLAAKEEQKELEKQEDSNDNSLNEGDTNE